MLIDSHCHLNFEAFEKDYKAVADRCFKRGMKLITVGSQYETSKKAVKISHEFEHVFCAVGLHPIHVMDEEFNKEDYLKLAHDQYTVAIGETGLDYYRIWADSENEEKKVKAKQRNLFKDHLILARELDKPVILHCRDAYDDMIEILNQENNVSAVVHCFLGSKSIGHKFLDMGYYLGFTGIITYTDDKKLLDFIAKDVPLERMLIETDAPYLTPKPFREKRNEPIYVEYVAKKIAELKNIPVDQVIEQTGNNAQSFFKI